MRSRSGARGSDEFLGLERSFTAAVVLLGRMIAFALAVLTLGAFLVA